MATSATGISLSFLDLVNLCDNVHIRRPSPTSSPFNSEQLIPLYLTPSPTGPIVGLLRPIIVDQLRAENERSRQHGLQEVWDLRLDTSTFGDGGHLRPGVSFQHWVDTPSKQTAVMKEICERWRDTGLFEDVCGPKKWRAEMYPVYSDPFGAHDHPDMNKPERTLNYAFEMERSACALFGVVTYGVHMTIYDEVEETDGVQSIRIWVPTRARTKPTFPGYLDNTVAGGTPSGMSIFESLVKESMEEASIAEDIIRKHVRAVGSISYFFRTSKGWLQPEVEYVYDLRIPPGTDPTPFKPKPQDGEVECFEFLPQDVVISKMRAGLFKPNCGLVLIDLFIRLGYITPDNEPDFMKIVTRLHSRFDYDYWSL